MPRLMWFRSDLRVGDNRALIRACEGSDDGVVGVFIITPGQWQAHDWGAPKVGFVLRSLADLKDRLDTLNIPLRILESDDFRGVPKAIAALAREIGAEHAHWNREYEVNEIERDEAVVAALEKAGVTAHAEHDQCAGPVHEIRTQTGGFYTVYSPFRRAWEARFRDAGGFEPEDAPRKQPAVKVEPDPVPTRVKGYDPAPIDWDLWPTGEQAARQRLSAFIRHKGKAYKDERDYPAIDATSTLSPYLAAGVISPRVCFHAAFEANGHKLDSGSKGLVHWMQELVWREFYRHVLIGFPRVSRHQPFRADTRSIPWREDADAFEAWRDGRTGYPIVDAAMRQLAATGWMHNRVRMIVAMFLSKDLLLDWRLGERHFMRSLVDADLANNNGGWQWSSSTGTDAAPYFRIYNPTTQGERYDAEGDFIRRYVPELKGLDAKAIHDPAGLDRERLGYPQPMVDHKAARERAIAVFKGS